MVSVSSVGKEFPVLSAGLKGEILFGCGSAALRLCGKIARPTTHRARPNVADFVFSKALSEAL